MKIKHNQNFWEEKENRTVGIPNKVNWKFTYDKHDCFIPMIYQFKDAITINIINILDSVEIKNFFDKYKDIEMDLTEEERIIAENEHPIPEFHMQEVHINNELAQVIGSNSSSYISFLKTKHNEDFLSEINNEFELSIDKDVSFQCIRVHVRLLKDFQKDINALRFTASKTETLIPIKKHFTIDLEKPTNNLDVVFKHPLTGEGYTIYINEVELHDAKLEIPHRDSGEPHNFVWISYEIAPSLPLDERLFLMEVEQDDEEKEKSHSASAVGVIYSKNNLKTGIHGYTLNFAITKMYYKTLRHVKMSIVGIYKEKSNGEEITVVLGE